jgi:alkylation response protein AidB-like acyl-CoA dehydrogenase
MAVDRLLPTDEGAELVAVIREIAQAELAPRAAADEAAARFPRDAFAMLGEVGLLGLPYPAEYGSAGQPYEIYLQALEEVAMAWMSVGVGVSVHVMATYAMAAFGTPEQRASYLPEMISGQMLGAYALSEVQAGSDISAMMMRAKHADHGYELNGAKAWTTHGAYADFYTTFARTSDDPRGGVTCFHVPGRASGLTFGRPEHKMGLSASPTTALYFDAVSIEDSRRIGDEGQGARIALSALDSGRLGIAACATGLAQAALDLATEYAKQREQFGRPIAELGGCDSYSRRWRLRLILHVRLI